MTQPRPGLQRIDNPNPQLHGVGHPHIDRRTLAMARLAAEKTDRDSEPLLIAVEFLGDEKPGHRWKEARHGAGERTKSHRQRPPAVLTAEDRVDAGEQQIELG